MKIKITVYTQACLCTDLITQDSQETVSAVTSGEKKGVGWSAGSAISARPVCLPMRCLSTSEDIACVGRGPVREVGPISVEVDLDIDTVMEKEMEEEG